MDPGATRPLPLHRSYRGRMVYSTNGVGETGREFYSVTVQPDGSRTLRAQCEMDDDRLLRDTVLTLGPDWRPRDGFMRLTLGGAAAGSTWFRFEDEFAECEGQTLREGRFRQRFDVPGGTHCFGTHSLHGDAWTVARLRRHAGAPDAFPFVTFASSVLPNGGSGPVLIPVPAGFARVRDLGEERVRVPAGEFACTHVRIEVPGVDCFDVWAAGDDALPIRLTSDVLNQTYETVALEGEWR
jgi:hypothetical protein